MSNIKNDISVMAGILSVIICLILGLVGNSRIATVLFRTLVCFAITAILCLFVVTAVEKFSQIHKSTSQQLNVDKSNKLYLVTFILHGNKGIQRDFLHLGKESSFEHEFILDVPSQLVCTPNN